jgi:NADH-quinone oxidoreductase subunit L
MVTAGVYMIARCGTLFVTNTAAMSTVAAIGAFTALLAALIALRQFDLKKVFAYSTISQLGYMFVGVGCFAPVAGVFHLVTHAFFKALLFLSCGVVMHAMYGELDMRKMSGLKQVLPKTRYLMGVGCLALAGFPFLSGFFSKDAIVGAAFEKNGFLGVLMLFTAFLTAYYTFRLYFRVFEGPLVTVPPPETAHGHDAHGHDPHGSDVDSHLADPRGTHDAHDSSHEHHDHEPSIMIVPLILLALGACFAGFINFPDPHLNSFLGASPSLSQAYAMAKGSAAAPDDLASYMGQSHESEGFSMLMLVSGLISIAGIGLAYVLHLKDRALGDELAERFAPITRVLEAKFWVDELYQDFIVNPLWMLGEIAYAFDRWVVDMLVNLTGWFCQLVGYLLKFTTQRGYLQGYAAAMLLGLAAILLLVFIR